jgi:hypothetical protein
MGVLWVGPAQGNTKESKRRRYEETERMRINGSEREKVQGRNKLDYHLLGLKPWSIIELY